MTSEIYTRLADLTRVVIAPAAPQDLARQEDETLTVLRSRHASSRGLRTAFYLRDAARLARPHLAPGRLLHCNHLFAAYSAYWLRLRADARYLVWVHGEELTKHGYPALARLSLRSAAAILVNSDFTAERVRALLEGRTPPIHKIPLGADARFLSTPPSPSAGGARLPRILTLARLSTRDRYKGLDVALHAMALLRSRGLAIEYHIAGDGDDRAYLEGLVRGLELEQVVTFLGPVPPQRLVEAYDGCDLFLLCSREQPSPRGLGFEGFGIVFLEAAARGKAVVAGRSGGIPDAVADGQTGILVDPASPAAVADGIQRLLSDEGLRQRLGQAGRARVETTHNWDQAAAAVRRIHAEVLA